MREIVTANRHTSPVDTRPFQTRQARERQEDLTARYGKIAIDEVVAALRQLKAAADGRSATDRAA